MLLNLKVCQYKECRNKCSVIKKLVHENSLSNVTDKDCETCFSFPQKGGINEFTLCSAIRRILDSGRYTHQKHQRLVTAVKCAIGPGTRLHKELHWLSSKDCGCASKVMLMNEMGPLECKSRVPEIVKWLKEATIAGGFDFVELALTGMVHGAINESVQLYEQFNLLEILELQNVQ